MDMNSKGQAGKQLDHLSSIGGRRDSGDAGATTARHAGHRDGLAVREHLVALAVVALVAILPILTILGSSPGGLPAAPDAVASGKRRGHDDRAGARRNDPVREPCGPNLQPLTVDGTVLCVPPPLPPPAGFDVRGSVRPLPDLRAADRAVQCVGDGVSGPRISALYVYDASQGSRFAEYRDSFQGWLSDMDERYEQSAELTGGSRHVRFLTDAACRPVVREVGVPAGSLGDFAASIAAVRAAGYAEPQRNYLMFTDANVYCGIGTVRDDDRPTPDNLNNLGGGYARVDRGCWSGFVAAHESMHTLGAVQLSAPHSTGAWHCTDERDIMCYSDQGTDRPPMQLVCTTGIWARGDYFDCNHDDYFDTDPASGSYLATHWNAANSAFLVAGAPATAGELTLSAGSAAPGGQLRANVAHFPAGAAVQILVDDAPVATGAAGGDGTASIAFTVPEIPGGDHRVRAASGETTAGAPLRVTAVLLVPAGTVKPGASLVAKAAGFQAAETVAFTLDGAELARALTRGDGTATVELTVPAGARKGAHTLSAQGDAGTRADAQITVGKTRKRH